MSNTLSKLFVFATGAAVGSVVTLCLVRAKYEKMTLDEIRSIRELYKSSGEDDIIDTDLDDEEKEDLDDAGREEYETLVKKYSRISPATGKKEEKEDEEMREPYVIEPEEFDENGYETVSLYWFEDGVVTYAISGEVVDDIDEIIGEDAPNYFGVYEDDTVYIRNDRLETDFELLRDGRKYSEVN